MRKKLFAVIMSAMMMITFMPAMAFAAPISGDLDYPTVTVEYPDQGWYLTGFKAAMKSFNYQSTGAFTYDGQEHTASWVQKNDPLTVASYSMKYATPDVANPDWTNIKATTSQVVKAAGTYQIVATVLKTENGHVTYKYETLTLTVKQRDVAVQGFGTLVKTKAYDKTGFTLSDKDFTIVPILGTDGKEVAGTGLVAGDTLLTKVITTAADVGVYDISGTAKDFNANYRLCDEKGVAYAAKGFTNKLVLSIVKADNKASIASQVLTIKRGSSKPVKCSATFGTVKLTKLSGNTKISVSNGKIKVKKSCKKGTYKVKVKASVAGNNNYASASRVKTLTIKVK